MVPSESGKPKKIKGKLFVLLQPGKNQQQPQQQQLLTAEICVICWSKLFQNVEFQHEIIK